MSESIQDIIKSHPFPIDYLETKHSISPTVKSDLELESTIYPIVFGKESNLISQWSRSTTTNTEFIKETQDFISRIEFENNIQKSEIQPVWKSL